MKMIPLTQGQCALVDDEDFEWLSNYKWCAYHPKRRRPGCWYAHRGIYIKGPRTIRDIAMHRAILNAPRGTIVDHRDGNGLNNQRSNLRLCNGSQNGFNRAANVNSKSGLKGIIRLANGLWTAQIRIGTFATKEAAIIAYNEAVIKYHGEFAYLNK
jgi:hypothetical protein